MLRRNSETIFQEEIKDKGLICIGAGRRARNFLEDYADQVTQVIVCDEAEERQGTLFQAGQQKYEVREVESVMTCDSSKYVIVIASERHISVYNRLRELGAEDFPVFVYPFVRPRKEMFWNQVKRCFSDYYYHNHMDLSKRDDYIRDEMARIQEGELVLPYLPVYLTTKCTLNCDKCNNLMPYFEKEKREFSLERSIQSLETILNQVKELTFCELVGGEPFLYGRLDEMLDFVGNHPKIRQIVVVTNGTIIPREDILERLAKYHVLVRISDYGMFEKMARLVTVLEAYDINVRVLQDMTWNDPGEPERRGRTEEEIYFQYNRCEFSLKCKYLMEDKLFTCARIASLYLLGRYNAAQDMLVIDDTLTGEKLLEFYLRDYGEGCDYCDLCSIDRGDEIPAALQRGRENISHSAYTIIRNDYLERLKKQQT